MIPPRFFQAACRLQVCRSMWVLLATALLWWSITIPQAAAALQIVTGEGEYRLGDRDTKEDGIRFATEQAKRQALDQVASYLESVTVVRDLDVTQEEIRSYTAGVVLILDQRVSLTLEDQTVVVHVALRAQIDTDEVVQALAAVKQHEDARQELVALQQELDHLHQELDAANRQLAAATTPEQRRQSRQQRDELLNRTQSNAMVAQAWTDWLILISPVLQPSAPSIGGMPQVQALIAAAGRLNPNNPHLNAVQQAVVKQPPAPPVPPTPPVPQTVPLLPRMPTHQIVPRREPPSDSQGLPSSSRPPTLHTWPRTPAPLSRDASSSQKKAVVPRSTGSGVTPNASQQPGATTRSMGSLSKNQPHEKSTPGTDSPVAVPLVGGSD